MEIFDLAEVFGPAILASRRWPPTCPRPSRGGARPATAPPRILETAGGMINAIGLSGEGLEAFVGRPSAAPAAASLPADPERRRASRSRSTSRWPRASATRSRQALGDALAGEGRAGAEHLLSQRAHRVRLHRQRPGETETVVGGRAEGVARAAGGQAHAQRHRHRRHRPGRGSGRAPTPSLR